MSEKREKAQPGASNEIREIGEVEREEKAKGFVDTGNEGEDNEGLKGEGVLMSEETEQELEDESDEVEEVEGGFEGIAEELEDNGNRFGDDDEGVEGNSKEV